MSATPQAATWCRVRAAWLWPRPLRTAAGALAAVLVLSHCAAPVPPAEPMQPAAEARRLVSDSLARAVATPPVTVSHEPYIRATAFDYADPQDAEISLHVAGAPLRQVLDALARPRGWVVTYVGRVRPEALVAVELRDQGFERAMREVAFAAGYAAVLDARRREALIAEEATVMFRVPPSVAERTQTRYSVQSNPGGAAATSSMNGGGLGTAAGASLGTGSGAQAGGPGLGGTGGSNTTISGASARSADALIAALASIAGGAPRVQFIPESSIVTVHGNAHQLRRAADLIDAVTREAAQQVLVEAAMVEVSLERQFQFGIDWQRVFPGGGSIGSNATATLQVLGAAGVAQPSLQTTVTGASFKSVINALDALTRVKVIAQPSAITRNHGEVILYRGHQVPYLAEVTQQAVANVGTTSAARVDYVAEGTSLAVRAAILDGQRVDLRIAPQQIQGLTFQTFNFGTNASVTAPNYPLSQAWLSLIVEPERTYVIGGMNLDSDNRADQRVPGVADVPWLGRLATTATLDAQRTQLVLLLRARILPAPATFDSRVGETL